MAVLCPAGGADYPAGMLRTIAAVIIGSIVAGAGSWLCYPYVPAAVDQVLAAILPAWLPVDVFNVITEVIAMAGTAAPGVLVAILIVSRRRRWPRGHCRRCGYNLEGNVSGVCPECGEPTPWKAARSNEP